MSANQQDESLKETVVVSHTTDAVSSTAEPAIDKLTSLLDYQLEEELPSFSRIFLVSTMKLTDIETMKVIEPSFEELCKDFRLPLTGLGVIQDTVFAGIFECFPDGE